MSPRQSISTPENPASESAVEELETADTALHHAARAASIVCAYPPSGSSSPVYFSCKSARAGMAPNSLCRSVSSKLRGMPMYQRFRSVSLGNSTSAASSVEAPKLNPGANACSAAVVAARLPATVCGVSTLMKSFQTRLSGFHRRIFSVLSDSWIFSTRSRKNGSQSCSVKSPKSVPGANISSGSVVIGSAVIWVRSRASMTHLGGGSSGSKSTGRVGGPPAGYPSRQRCTTRAAFGRIRDRMLQRLRPVNPRVDFVLDEHLREVVRNGEEDELREWSVADRHPLRVDEADGMAWREREDQVQRRNTWKVVDEWVGGVSREFPERWRTSSSGNLSPSAIPMTTGQQFCGAMIVNLATLHKTGLMTSKRNSSNESTREQLLEQRVPPKLEKIVLGNAEHRPQMNVAERGSAPLSAHHCTDDRFAREAVGITEYFDQELEGELLDEWEFLVCCGTSVGGGRFQVELVGGDAGLVRSSLSLRQNKNIR
uniref:Uncharacterized protein n=1 Tax=Mycena chlorophos TaxID=658473 RepID=A0ABQ0LN17_MYCCL|nr:predicted protein [Mycena chlorophos]